MAHSQSSARRFNSRTTGEISHLRLQEVEEEGAREADTSPQETLTAAKAQDNAEAPPPSPPPSGEESTPPLVPSHPSNTPGESLGGRWGAARVRPGAAAKIGLALVCAFTDGPAEPCWYCLRSLDAHYRPEAPRQVSTTLAKHIISAILPGRKQHRVVGFHL